MPSQVRKLLFMRWLHESSIHQTGYHHIVASRHGNGFGISNPYDGYSIINGEFYSRGASGIQFWFRCCCQRGQAVEQAWRSRESTFLKVAIYGIWCISCQNCITCCYAGHDAVMKYHLPIYIISYSDVIVSRCTARLSDQRVVVYIVLFTKSELKIACYMAFAPRGHRSNDVTIINNSSTNTTSQWWAYIKICNIRTP